MEELKYSYKYPHPAVTTDCVIFGFDGTKLKVLLIERGIEPFKGKWALPGGFLRMDEDAMKGALRELKEETGLDVTNIEYLFSSPNVYVYSGMGVHTLDMDYLARVHGSVPAIKAADDAAEAIWIPIAQVNPAEFGLTSIRNAVIRFLREYKHWAGAIHTAPALEG